MLSDSDIELRSFPNDVMKAAEEVAFELYDEFAAQDTDFGSILEEWKVFRDSIQAWHSLGETSVLTYMASSR